MPPVVVEDIKEEQEPDYGGGGGESTHKAGRTIFDAIFYDWGDAALRAVLGLLAEAVRTDRDRMEYLLMPGTLPLDITGLFGASAGAGAGPVAPPTSWMAAIEAAAASDRPDLLAWRRTLLLGAIHKAHPVRELFFTANAAMSNKFVLEPPPRGRAMVYMADLRHLIETFQGLARIGRADADEFILRARSLWTIGLAIVPPDGTR